MKKPLKIQVAFLALMLNLNVPFVSQAPLKEWSNLRFQDACEETSVYMAIKWVKGKSIGTDKKSLQVARDDIMKMSLWQSDKYNNYHDTAIIKYSYEKNDDDYYHNIIIIYDDDYNNYNNYLF